ncbi:alpha/beta hydrolase [Amycolatopsis sp. OK19-0408]|uniref:Alpha/beta hydrolase n=1 Tax=Amycolatopsis iheyensis TaxID=2945988 RepID=A0A9X2SM41_9PSEU|nr:alpha/beta hydrolase [Amycolatopsis iheyensis]MCR6487387.1 alpha/beta hydrolase [Amycolatopsis iheyensis]
MTTAERAYLDREFSPSRLVPDIGHYLREYSARSAEARAAFAHRTLRYGTAAPELLDFFPVPGAAAAPLMVFVHGGFWQESGREQAAFTASGFLERGVAYAALGYGLAPAHRLDGIVAMVRRAVRLLARTAPVLGVDPARIHLAGSSAGAHLAAMALGDPHVAGVSLLSGIYDLEPMTGSYVNEALGLTRAEARRLSPLGRLPRGLPPIVLARGEHETGEFIRQHNAMSAALTAAGGDVTDLVIAGRTHFDVPYDLPDPTTPLGAAVARQLAAGRTVPAARE